MTELIVNGDAEQGLTGWLTVAGTPAAIRYDRGDGYPGAGDPGPANRGTQFFGGGTSPRSTLRQSVTMPRRAASFTVSAWLGGYAGQQDGAQLTVEFLDCDGIPRGAVVLGPLTASERGSATGLFERTARGTVPPGSRRAVVTLLMTRAGSGTSNDGYADNISLTVTGGR
ncbi:phosphoesterase [Lentzea tibetensis]|uniref:Phosphoesterase n=1 Tax=Lentzea tibetensis TaxID=2591470 RepID=A0A563ERF1_9PSEU|nr:phosphoesterase [Lentzea tibetensis]TWP50240.1 phosphoesterase [Lentzea tibetensis]